MKEGSDTDIQKLKIHAKTKPERKKKKKWIGFCASGFFFFFLVAVVMTRAPRDSRNVETKHQPNLL